MRRLIVLASLLGVAGTAVADDMGRGRNRRGPVDWPGPDCNTVERPVVRADPWCKQYRTCERANAMATCAEAVFRMNVCGDSGLDADGDGIPCENLCGSTLDSMRGHVASDRFRVLTVSEAVCLSRVR